jgi:hypothetical protein
VCSSDLTVTDGALQSLIGHHAIETYQLQF